jgi:hypothetical protein
LRGIRIKNKNTFAPPPSVEDDSFETPVMTLRIAALLVASSLLASSTWSRAQEPESLTDSTLTLEQWQQRVQDARQRSEAFVANARNRTADPPSLEKEDAEAADQRAMNDPSLQPGDIVATSRGLLIFVGRDKDERRTGDFLPAPNPQRPP